MSGIDSSMIEWRDKKIESLQFWVRFLAIIASILLVTVGLLYRAARQAELDAAKRLESYTFMLPTGSAPLKVSKRVGKDGTEFYEVEDETGKPIVYAERR